MGDIGKWGAPSEQGGYAYVRDTGGGIEGLSPAEFAATYYIDGLGEATRVAVAAPGAWTPEQIAALPTLEEAITHQLSPAFEEAEANLKAWQSKQPKDAPKPEVPPQVDRATERFLDDGDGLW